MNKLTIRAEQAEVRPGGWNHVVVEMKEVQAVDLVQQIGAETLLDWVGRETAMRHFGLVEDSSRYCPVCHHCMELCQCEIPGDEDIPSPPEPFPDFINSGPML